MKRFLTIIMSLCAYCAVAQSATLPKMFAHRGGHTREIPENTPTAVASAKSFGYMGVELDVRKTKDGKLVVFHDRTINRKMRHAADYSTIEEKLSVKELTFDELRNNYVLASPNPAMRQPVATLDEILLECKRQGMMPMLHSKYVESYRRAQELFGDEWICFTTSIKSILECRKFSKCLVLLGITPKTAEESFEQLKLIGGHCGVSSMQSEALSEERIQRWLKEGYEVQASIFKRPKEVEATRRGVTMHLSDYAIMPDTRFNEVGNHSCGKRNMKAGEELSRKWDKLERGGIAATIHFRGEIELELNSHKYTLSSDGRKPLIVGTRFVKGTPSIVVRALDKCRLNSLDCRVYKF